MRCGMRQKAVLVLGLVLLVLAVACAGGPPKPVTPLEALSQRAQAVALERSNGAWLEAYKYLSPRSREVCATGDFAASMGQA